MKSIRWLLLALLFTVYGSPFTSPAAAAQDVSPTLIPFQGRLTDQAGVAYTNGQYTLTFNLYDQAVGGSTVWTERHEKVGVINGMVNVFLGSIQSIEGIGFETTKYLGITVDADDNPATADPEMVPRTMIIPAFYAKNAQNLGGFDWTHILAGGSNNPQTGFLNGGKIQENSITHVQIGTEAITADNIGGGQVTGPKLAPGAADSAISDGGITSAKIGVGEVKAENLEDGAVTIPKLANDVESRLGMIESKLQELEAGTWNETEESLGTLPLTTTNLSSYIVPEAIPAAAKQILLYATSYSGNSGSNQSGHVDIYTKEGASTFNHRYRHYSYPNSAISFNSSTFWVPLTAERTIYAKSSVAHSTNNIGSSLVILGWR